MRAARIYLCERRVLRGPRASERASAMQRGVPTYVYLDGKHSHDYAACNAIPSVDLPERTATVARRERSGRAFAAHRRVSARSDATGV